MRRAHDDARRSCWPRFRSALVFIQPDFGTALVYGAAFAAVLFVAGTRWLMLAALGVLRARGATVLILWVLPAVGVHVLQAVPGSSASPASCIPTRTRRERRTTSTQSKVAVGAGGFDGRGVAGATQTNLVVPARARDRLRLRVVRRAARVHRRGDPALPVPARRLAGLRIITVARDLFSAIVAGGIVVALLFQIFVNVGMTMGIAPITGIPLPFVSVGGSSMIANLAAMGVLLSIHARGTPFRRR